ncbi:MAG TPA: L,D-transpeptidase family protein [Thermoanaerobaculia bacterium]
MVRLAKVVAVLGFLIGAAVAQPVRASEPVVVGGEFDYTVRRGDSLTGIGAVFAAGPNGIAARNGLSASRKLRPGQVLRVDNRHIVPGTLDDGILVNLPQRLLFLFEGGRVVAWYPVAIGRADWQTPTGSYKIVSKEKNPTWDVPKSIQQEMRSKGERVRTKVLPGPDNPLGNYWLGLSMTCCGIHGTNAPQSIYTFQTHGCIRLSPQNAKELFSRVSVGLPVEIVYEPVLMARDENGDVFLEVHPDVYRQGGNAERAVAVAQSRGLLWAPRSSRWAETVENESGIALPLREDRPVLGGGFDRETRPAGTSRFE